MFLDTKFSIKVRLLNATKTFHFLLRTHYNCSKMLFPLLLVIKALAKNSYTTTVLAKDGICSTMEKTVLTIGVTPNNKLRLALNVLSCLSKNSECRFPSLRANLVCGDRKRYIYLLFVMLAELCSGRMVKCGLVSLLLRIFERWERYDGKMRLRICSFTLSALQHICMISVTLATDWTTNDLGDPGLIPIRPIVVLQESGRKAMRANNGLQLLHKFSSVCPEQKGYDSLLSKVCAILNLCAEKRQLPLDSQHSPATFALPLPSCPGDTLGPRASSISRDTSPDSDDDSNDDLSPEDLEEGPETDKDKFPDELFYLCPVQRSWEDLKHSKLRAPPQWALYLLDVSSARYEGNASEIISSNWDSASLERILETRRSFAFLGALNSTLSYASFMLDGSNEDSDRSPTPFADPLMVKRSDLSFADCAAEMMSSIDGRHKRKGAADRVPSKAEVVGDAESHGLKLAPSREKGSRLLLDTDVLKSPEEGSRMSRQALRGLTALDKLHERMAPRDAYCAVASRVKSVLPFVKVPFPDMVGGHSADKPEPLNIKDRKVCRAKLLSCVERSIHPSQSLNKVVFNIDLLAAQTKHSATRSLSNDDESRLGRKVPAVDTLLFESRFESGNLRKVLQVASKEYDLILMPDVNSCRHHQWFYFEVSNMESKTPYQFNIINCEKQNSQFNFGMKPLLYSVREATLGRTGWVRTGRDICYYRNSYQNLGSKGRSYFTTTFTVEFPHAYDVCYVAYHYPYTYSQLLVSGGGGSVPKTQIWKWETVVNPAVAFFRAESLCSSLNGNETPLLTITAPESKYNPIAVSTLWSGANYTPVSQITKSL
uniref:Cytosolic carboxypeptidase N-terminal domain-containing protein n=1 Tax=Timema genevievae TaxID=629358 RepID=A0A7R9PND9_TIMGE|nr:unnamed protein product [Timema genevievae]